MKFTPLTLACCSALASFSLLCEQAYAASAPGMPAAAADLETIVVTASGSAQMLKEAPASISVLSKEDLSERLYRDLTDAMTDIPGVVVTGGGDREDISLRGMGSQYTLILVDGQRQSSRETRPNSDGPGVEGAWIPPLSAIERIEVIRGPMSSLYGSDAIGGVINIITAKTPDEWRGEMRFDATLQESSESGNQFQTTFFTAGSLIPGKLGLQLYGQYSQREEDNIVDGFRDRDNKNISAKLAFTPNDNHEFVIEATHTMQEIYATLGKTVAELAEGEACGRRGCPESSLTEYDRTNLSLSHTGYWGWATSQSYVKQDEFDNDSRQMFVKNIDTQTMWAIPLTDQLSLSAGGAFFKEELNDLTSNQVSDLSLVDGHQWSVFSEGEWKLTEEFALTTGIRYDDDQNFGGQWSPRLYGVWQLSSDTILKGGISTGFRAPNLRQMNPSWGQISRGGNIYGNPDLAAETSTSYEFGLYQDFGKDSTLSATVFYNKFEDKITRIECPETLCTDGLNDFGSAPTTYVNVDEAITQGFELSVEAALSDSIEFNANYTYTDSEQKTGQYAGSPLNQLPKHLVQTSFRWSINDAASSWLRVNYRGEESQPTTGPSQDSLIAPSYTLADLGFNYSLTTPIKLGAGIYNLFDKQIGMDEYGYVEDGRRYWLSLTWSF
ncbi:ligand-gated channel protein [Alteromonas lipolytica]|uniref:Outer membrane siderophore receptor n=1 Tax=Alteromonas lipolytica TaxID=1856405 RepID=A0A1E8FA26_9ALTE|nr:ligand-gated channel protein [Alteromonas lipolytica]OFI32772.1 outer membrane siderophore receptor [Alteromonas lipolytica]GGF73170.1 ligand-gated channel protein [Alteromonas lipolytica]